MAPNHTAYLGIGVHVMFKVEGPQNACLPVVTDRSA